MSGSVRYIRGDTREDVGARLERYGKKLSERICCTVIVEYLGKGTVALMGDQGQTIGLADTSTGAVVLDAQFSPGRKRYICSMSL